MREAPNQRLIWLALSAMVTLFRVNTGRAWVGSGQARRGPDGSVSLPGARPIALGFGLLSGDPVVGAGDLCGWRTVEITPDMVGCSVAVFTSVECKRPDGGRTTPDQRRWADTIIAAGGIAGVAASAEEARGIVLGWRPLRRQRA